jgi:hypothetical protein
MLYKPKIHCLSSQKHFPPGGLFDFLLIFPYHNGKFFYEERLNEWLSAKVDLVTKATLKPRIGRRILSEVTML